MAITKNKAHQWVLSSIVGIAYDDMGADSSDNALFELPGDALIVGGAVHVSTALSGGTISAGTITVNLALAGGDVAYATTVDLTSAGSTALTLTGDVTGEVADVDCDIDVTGANPTAGQVYVEVQYIRLDRANETRG